MNIPQLDLPAWLPWFLIGGVGLVLVGVPLKVLYDATRSGRDRGRKIDSFIDRLRERFSEVSALRLPFRPIRVSFRHEARKYHLWLSDLDEVVLEVDGTVRSAFPLVVKTRGRMNPAPLAFVGLRPVSRVPIHDAMVDDAVTIYTTDSFGGYLRELILEGLADGGKPGGIAESLVVLRRAPGVKWFRLTAAPDGPLRLRFKLHAEDLFFRPDEVESIVHHLGNLYERLVRD